MQSIPLVDLSNTTGVSREIEKACRDIGFMYVAGHAIPPRVIADGRDSVISYFSQPVDIKLRDRISQDNYRGYIPTGFFTANSGDERYSFPYFAVPRFDTVVEPLITPQSGFDRSSVHVGDVSKEVWRTNWPDVVSDKPHFNLGTLED